MVKVCQLLDSAEQLRTTSDSPQVDCEMLLCHVLEVDRSWLRTWPDAVVDAAQVSQFQALLAARVEGVPIAYLIGCRGFWNLDLKLTADTLIPRPETELLVETALDLPLPACSQVLDLGTGSGAIALALASERPDWQLTAVDSQSDTLAVAKQNCYHHGLQNVQMIQSNWFAEIAAQFNLIVSNPPYIEQDDPHLQRGDLRFEPIAALVSGADGLNDLKHIIKHSPRYLTDDGWLVVEHGFNQGSAVRNLFVSAGFAEVVTQRDYSQLERVTLGQWRL